MEILKRGVGRPRVYFIHKLYVGQATLVPWRGFDIEKFRPLKADLIHAAIRQEQRRYGKRFLRDRLVVGLAVKRIA